LVELRRRECPCSFAVFSKLDTGTRVHSNQQGIQQALLLAVQQLYFAHVTDNQLFHVSGAVAPRIRFEEHQAQLHASRVRFA
jgi:hypothetical protein